MHDDTHTHVMGVGRRWGQRPEHLRPYWCCCWSSSGLDAMGPSRYTQALTAVAVEAGSGSAATAACGCADRVC